MEETALQELVESISVAYFGRFFDHRAIFNSRLRTTGGRYHLNTHNLDFNPKILDSFGMEVFVGLIKHELCHYHLHLDNKGYRHGDADFRNLLNEVGGLRYTPSIELKLGEAERWLYQCSHCEIKLYRKRRFNLKKFVCGECKNKLELLGREKIIL